MIIPRHVETLVVAGSAFVTTTCLSSILKYLFKHEEFAYPLFVTSTHMILSYAIAHVGIMHLKMNASTFRVFDRREQLFKITPISICTALSMGLSNLALKFLYPSFVAMISAGLPLVTIVLACIFQTEKFNRWTYISMIPIFYGLFLSSHHEVNFNAFGFSLLLLAVTLRGLKQVLQARILRDDGHVDALTLLYYVAPNNLVIFVFWSLAAEGTEPYHVLFNARWRTWAVLLLSAGFAAAFNLLTFRAITLLNATAWSLMGMVNAPMISLVSYLCFGNAVGSGQITGFTITLLGVWLYHRKGRVPSAALDKMPVDYEKIDIADLEIGRIDEEEDSPIRRKSKSEG